jgi:putative peptidoglycan lipid II flippase
MTNRSMGTKIGVASFIMMTSVFSSRVIGLFREMSIAYIGGTSAGVDAYQIAFVIPEILNHIVASGFLSITFIPIFSRYLNQNNELQGWKVFSIVFNTFGLLMLTGIGISLVFAPQLVSVFAPGIKDPATFAMAVKMTRIIIPAQFFFFTGGLFMAVQFAKEKFLIPALAPLIYNICIITGGLLLHQRIGMEGFAWGVLFGAFLGNFILQFMGAVKVGLRYFLIWDLKHPDFKRYLWVTLPLMVGVTMTFSSEIMFKFFGSFLEEGSIAILNYNFRIMFILIGFFGQAVGMASYPYMAKLAAQNKITELNRLLNHTLQFLFLVIPFSVLFSLLKYEIIFILFNRGGFDLQSTVLTSQVLPYFMAGAVAFTCQTLVVRGYYAIQNTWFPAIFNSLMVIVFLPVYYILLKLMGMRGLASGISFAVIFQTFLLYELWNRKSHNHEKKEVYTLLVKIIFISLGMGALLLPVVFLLQSVISSSTLTGALSICVITGSLFLILLFISGHVFNISQISIFYQKVIGTLSKS